VRERREGGDIAAAELIVREAGGYVRSIADRSTSPYHGLVTFPLSLI